MRFSLARGEWEFVGADEVYRHSMLANQSREFLEDEEQKVELELSMRIEPDDLHDLIGDKYLIRNNNDERDTWFLAKTVGFYKHYPSNGAQTLTLEVEAENTFGELDKQDIDELVVEHGVPPEAFEDILRPRQIKFLQQRA